VVAPWFFVDEPLREESLLLRRGVSQDPVRYVVPFLFQSELLHVLARRSGRDGSFVARALGLILRLGIRTIPLSEEALMRAGHWASRGLSGFDATFVALAEDLGGRWLTADERAAKVVGPDVAHALRSWAPEQSF
jgi:predicted nucleic acid-binding protein